MKDSDLPLLEKLCEKYESHDTENRYIDSLQLNKLLGSNIGLIGCEFKNGHLMERDIEERHPIQRVLLKTIASIGSLKALDFLENMMQRTLYEEFELFCVCAIRYRTFLNTEKIKQGISSIPPRVMKRMYDQYVYIPMIRMSNTLKTNKMSAWTDKVDREREERRRMENKAEKEARKKAKKEYVRKNSAYLESLHI